MRLRAALALLVVAAACGPAPPPAPVPAPPAAAPAIPLPDLSRHAPQVAEKLRAAHAAVVARGDADAWRHLGRVLLAHMEWADAEKAFAVAGEMPGPQQFECLYLAGAAAALAGSPADVALGYLQRALAIQDDYAPAHLACGARALDAGRLDLAEKEYRRAQQLGPSSHALLGLGRVAVERGRLDEALRLLEQARALDPRHVEVAVVLARTLAAAGRDDEAREVAASVPARHSRTYPQDPIMLRALAETVSYDGLLEQANRALAAGYPQDAVGFLQRAIALDPGSTDARLGLGRVLAMCGRHDLAVAAYREALTVEPGLGLASTALGESLEALGKDAEAEEAFRAGARLEPHAPETRHGLAAFLARHGGAAEARRLLETLVAETPDAVESRLLLAGLLDGAGERDAAREQVREALRHEPFNQQAREWERKLGR